jgi:regulatory protein
VAVAREIALRQLSVRDRTRHELEQALAKKNVPPEAAEQVLDRLTEVGLINDSAFAQAWFDNQQRRQRSTRALRHELRTKGVDAEVVSQASAGVADDVDLSVARALVAKRLPSLQRVPHELRHRRLAGQLARRGFSSGVVSAVLRELPRDDTDAVGDHYTLGDEALGADPADPADGVGE